MCIVTLKIASALSFFFWGAWNEGRRNIIASARGYSGVVIMVVAVVVVRD
jgi:hypothetical protein